MPFMELSFDEIPEVAGQLTQIAEALRHIAEDYEVYGMKCVKEAWEGRGAEIYIKKERRLMEELGGSAARIKKISDILEENAKRIYGAEMQNVMTAKYRNY